MKIVPKCVYKEKKGILHFMGQSKTFRKSTLKNKKRKLKLNYHVFEEKSRFLFIFDMFSVPTMDLGNLTYCSHELYYLFVFSSRK